MQEDERGEVGRGRVCGNVVYLQVHAVDVDPVHAGDGTGLGKSLPRVFKLRVFEAQHFAVFLHGALQVVVETRCSLSLNFDSNFDLDTGAGQWVLQRGTRWNPAIWVVLLLQRRLATRHIRRR